MDLSRNKAYHCYKCSLASSNSLLKADSFLVDPRRFMGARGSRSRSSSAAASPSVGVVAPEPAMPRAEPSASAPTATLHHPSPTA